MERAKAAVDDFLGKGGRHDTTVHEKVAPAVTHETVNKQAREDVQAAVDKEVHQDHYHTAVQPVSHHEVLPEQHHHNVGAVEERSFEHGSDSDVKARLEREAAQFSDKTVQGETQETQSVAPIVTGEHIHHHVHETIQPIVQKGKVVFQII